MSRFPLRFLRFAAALVVVALLAALPSFRVLAASVSSAQGTHRLGKMSGEGIRLNVPRTGTHFLYVDNGALGDMHDSGEVGMRVNSVSGFQITPGGLIPTPGSPYLTGGIENPAYGANSIATSLANGPCVFHTDGGSGLVESFAVASTGALTEVSAVSLSTLLGDADDIQVSADGKDVYVALWNLLGPSYLDVLTVGSGCALTLANSVERAGALYYSIALVGSNQLMATDFLGSRIDIYRITNGTQLTLLTSTPSQLLGPSGAAAGNIGGRNYVFNGLSATTLPGEAEAHTINSNGGLSTVLGSPAINLKSLDGAAVLFDRSHQQVIESDQLSNSLSVYGMRLGLFKFLGQATLPGLPVTNLPTAMAELGSELFVVDMVGGNVDACAIGSGSLSCRLATTLSIFESPDGIGVL